MKKATCSTQDYLEPPVVQRHLVTDVDREARTAFCVVCGPTKVRFRSSRNYYECRTVTARNRNVRREKLKQKYGITLEQYEEMYATADGACEICSDPLPLLHVDHDHVTGEIRGLLCPPCNKGLGHFRDDTALLAAAATYLGERGVEWGGKP